MIINRDGTSRYQWEPAIHVSNITSISNPRGTVHVTAIDRRTDPNNREWKIWHYSCTPGSSLGCRDVSEWINVEISDRAFHNADDLNIGDYHGITNHGIREAYTVWTDISFPNSFKQDIIGDYYPR